MTSHSITKKMKSHFFNYTKDGAFCFTGLELKRQQEKGAKPDYGNFAFELKKKDLKHFPVMFKFDDNFKFLGLRILR